jgi:hypothetical protein
MSEQEFFAGVTGSTNDLALVADALCATGRPFCVLEPHPLEFGLVQHGSLRQESFVQQLHREYPHQTAMEYARKCPELTLEWEDRGEERIHELKEKMGM